MPLDTLPDKVLIRISQAYADKDFFPFNIVSLFMSVQVLHAAVEKCPQGHATAGRQLMFHIHEATAIWLHCTDGSQGKN